MKQWNCEPPVISVPSGNFGNLASGILAHITGLQVKKFIAACNANDVVPRFLQSAEYEPRQSVPTLSNAMDVGSPSNFVRILEIFDNKFVDLKEKLESVSVSDKITAKTMLEVYEGQGIFSTLTVRSVIELYPTISKSIVTAKAFSRNRSSCKIRFCKRNTWNTRKSTEIS